MRIEAPTAVRNSLNFEDEKRLDIELTAASNCLDYALFSPLIISLTNAQTAATTHAAAPDLHKRAVW